MEINISITNVMLVESNSQFQVVIQIEDDDPYVIFSGTEKCANAVFDSIYKMLKFFNDQSNTPMFIIT